MTSNWSKWISQPGHIRLVAVEATDLMQELCKQQDLKGLAQQGFAEAVVGALLIASAHKSNESINLNAQGSGLFRQAIVDASPEGLVRGFLREQTDYSKHSFGADGKAGAWGTGVLSVLYTKNFEGKYPYTGMVPITNGHLDVAINEYYRDSEQLPSQIGLSVLGDAHGLRHARGILLQTLGGANEREIADVRSLNLERMREFARRADNHDSLRADVEKLLNRGFKPVESKELKAFCNCSQERIERALVLSGQEAILEALANDPFLTAVCDFCRKEYRISAERIRSLFSTDPSRLQ